jgi:uncharacterized lipoprotein
MNLITLQKDTKLKNIIKDRKNQKTMLTEWFQANKQDEDARQLTYCEFPQRWRWDKANKK